jgi:hypothetical protein
MQESTFMATVWGVVKDGLIAPSSPLPDGTRVEIRLAETAPEVSPELQEELEAWQRAGADSLALVERLARER